MSELKVYAPYDYSLEPDKCPALVYGKSEADKVIAELKDRLQGANEQIENLINSSSSIMLFQDRVNDDKCAELRHQKYKRCLAMARWCEAKYDEEDARVNGHYSSWEYISKEMKYWERWHRRWMELAEKFKPNNSTAQ